MIHKIVWGASFLLAFATVRAADTLPPLTDGKMPTNITEMWQGFDPLRDPLDVEIVREWKEGDATFRYVVFTIGTFKGQKSRVAAFYGFPKSGTRLPGLMHLHGGGQRAFIKTVRDAVKYGYAGISVNWGGREMEDAKPGDKNTDYNAITMGFKSFNYDKSKALDPGDSPRNSGWFMAVLVARRAITFLQQQPEVDPGIIGVHGHSMGGKITTDLAGVDKRVTAAVPSCGSSGTLTYGGKIWNIPGSIGKTAKSAVLGQNTYESQAYLPTLTCPILHLNPMNDYNSPIDILTENWEKAASKTVYFSNAPHMCHLHLPENEVCAWLWFDQWLVHGFQMPKNTEINLDFTSSDNIPRVIVKPDVSRKIKAVDIYYSTEPHIITRFWRDGEAKAVGDTYQAVCPILGLDKPFYAFANVTYELEEPFKTKYGIDRYIITSKELIILPDALVKAGVKATDTKSSLIEDFSRGWHDWYGRWDKTGGSMTTYKIKDPKWCGGDGDLFCMEVKSLRDTKIDLTFSYNRWNCFMGGNEPKARPGSYTVSKEIKGSPEWQTVSVGAEELYTESKGLQMPPENQWQTIADVNVNAKTDEIRKIYWEKRTGAIPASKPKAPAKSASKMSAKPKDALPELAGQSEEFKEAVRKSLEEEKKVSRMENR